MSTPSLNSVKRFVIRDPVSSALAIAAGSALAGAVVSAWDAFADRVTIMSDEEVDGYYVVPAALPAYFDSLEKTEGVIRDNAVFGLREATGRRCNCVLFDVSNGTDDPTTVGCPSMDGFLVSQHAGTGMCEGDIYAAGFTVWRCSRDVNTHVDTVNTFCLDPRSSRTCDEVATVKGLSLDFRLSE